MLVLLGGSSTPRLVQAFNITTREWQKYPDMPDGRYHLDCLVLPGDDGKILIAGGWSGSEAYRSAYVLDLTTGRYKDVASMNTERYVRELDEFTPIKLPQKYSPQISLSL